MNTMLNRDAVTLILYNLIMFADEIRWFKRERIDSVKFLLFQSRILLKAKMTAAVCIIN